MNRSYLKIKSVVNNFSGICKGVVFAERYNKPSIFQITRPRLLNLQEDKKFSYKLP